MQHEIGPMRAGVHPAPLSRVGGVGATPRARTVLIIEDDPLNRKLFRDLLLARGYDAHTAPDGPAGLARRRELSPDLILLDVQLPGLDGFGVAEAIAAEGDPTPIVAISAFAGAAEAARLRRAGCLDCLPKPVGIDRLLSRIDAALQDARR
jgi:two-component system cell cycle response regulator DivK